MDGKDVFAGGFHFVKDDGVGFEEVVVVVGDFFAAGILQGEDGLEPAGNGIGDVGNELACKGGDHQFLSGFRRKPVLVDFTGSNLSI